MPAPASSAGNAPPILRPREFQQFRDLAYRHCGLDLHNGKQGLIASRLARTLRELGLRSFRDYYDYVNSDATGAALANMVDRLTTNHTGFFREPAHFDFLRAVIFPRLRNRARIHIWSAACSTGEEPCSIAMSLLEEAPREAAAKIRIKATDISTRALATARSGAYGNMTRAAQISPAMQLRYLVPVAESASTLHFNDTVRSMIEFDRHNLMSPLPPDIAARHLLPQRHDLLRPLHAAGAGAPAHAAYRTRRLPLHRPRGDAPQHRPQPRVHSPLHLQKAALRHAATERKRIMALLTVGAAECRVSNDVRDILIAHALGSCIAVLLYEPVARVAGLLHFMLPDSTLDIAKAGNCPCMFADTGIPRLLRSAEELGAVRPRMMFMAAGGSSMFEDNNAFNVGARNHSALTGICARTGIALRTADIGGSASRTVRIDVARGRVRIRRAGSRDEDLVDCLSP